MKTKYLIIAVSTPLIFFIYTFGTTERGYTKTIYPSGSTIPIEARVHHIIDGDSLVVVTGKSFMEIRLWGIDAPEYDQPGSEEAKDHLRYLTEVGRLNLFVKDRDRYGRIVGIVECNGISVNEEMIASGNAWVHIYYCKESVCQKWKKLESSARKNNLGLWKWEKAIEPWKWKSKR